MIQKTQMLKTKVNITDKQGHKLHNTTLDFLQKEPKQTTYIKEHANKTIPNHTTQTEPLWENTRYNPRVVTQVKHHENNINTNNTPDQPNTNC